MVYMAVYTAQHSMRGVFVIVLDELLRQTPFLGYRKGGSSSYRGFGIARV
jgi:hypothetical protein